MGDVERQVIYLNGKNFRCWKTLGKELKKILFLGDSIDVKSLDVLNDVLRGGYGILDSNEDYTILWQHFARSERVVDEGVLAEMVSMFTENPHVTLVFE